MCSHCKISDTNTFYSTNLSKLSFTSKFFELELGGWSWRGRALGVDISENVTKYTNWISAHSNQGVFDILFKKTTFEKCAVADYDENFEWWPYRSHPTPAPQPQSNLRSIIDDCKMVDWLIDGCKILTITVKSSIDYCLLMAAKWLTDWLMVAK